MPLDYAQIIELINLLITIIGDVKLTEAKTWATEKANAEELRGEGHENDPPEAKSE
jgi:hypothetical protein